MKKNDDEILTVKEAAELLKIHPDSMYNVIHIEGFPAIHIGRRIRIPRAMLMEWVKAQAREGRTVGN